ncbi:MAG: ABC transporter substrate-binding protein [Candidatus Rokubacteria bacterium]|nr:ABC transporter substrate-binding protein [Candidatus Rokubacteria bacterium]
MPWYGGLSFEPFSQALRELGYIDYKNIVIERRSAGGDEGLLRRLAVELVALKVDVIVADSTPAALAVKSATKRIPVVAIAGDPVGSGLVASLARPGGNITGLSILAPELSGKRLDLLKQALPKVSRVAVFWTSTLTAEAVGLKEMQTAAQALGVKLSSLGARRTTGHADALAMAIKERADAIIVFGDDPLGAPPVRQILSLAAEHRLPVMYDRREYADAGGLMAYGVSVPDVFRRAAVYVDKILKGVKPADLPVEQPTKFELVVNLKTAKALGLTIPQSVLLRADHVIQ